MQWKSNEQLCICSLKYPACNAHAPYCHLWSTMLYNIFPHYLIKTRFSKKKKILNRKCVYRFSLQLLSETFFILGMNKNMFWSSHEVPFIFVRFKQNLVYLEFFFFRKKKHSNVNFNKIPSSGNGVVPCGQTDGHDEANSRFSQFCESA
jgi:hypothetical protein